MLFVCFVDKPRGPPKAPEATGEFMKNPFVYGETVSGRHFCNRVNEVRELIRDIENGQNVIIYSPRRYGKTSLIIRVLERVKRKGILTFYADLYPAINKEKFIEIYAKAITVGLPGKMTSVLRKIDEYLPRVIPKAVMNERSMQFELEFDRSADFSPHIDDLLVAAKKAADRHKKEAVVVFDEFQEIANFEDDEIERKMRSAFQAHRNVSYIFMGSKTHLMREIFNNPNRPFYKSGKHFPLQKIDPTELRKFAEDRFSSGGISAGKGEMEEVLNTTECHPYYFQMLCNVLWEICQDSGVILHHDIQESLDTLISRESSTYVAVWEGLTEKQRSLMVALASEKYPAVFSAGFLGRYSLGSSSSIQKALKRLMERDQVRQENGSYVIVDIFLKKWINRTWR